MSHLRRELFPPRSVPRQAAGELADPPPEAERRRLHPGAGLHGESVLVRAGQDFLPGLVPDGQLLPHSYGLSHQSISRTGGG